MNCPFCGKEMERGYLQSRDSMFWSRRKMPVDSLPSLSEDMIHVVGENVTSPSAEAWCCRNCSRLIVEVC